MLPSVLAHDAGGLSGDGVPGAVLYAGVVAGAVIGTLGLRARGPVPVGGPAVAPLTADASEVGEWPGDAMPAVVRLGGQIAGVVALVLVLVAGWGGSDLIGLNPLPALLGTVVWFAVPALALVFGDWWRVVDPFDAIAAGISRGWRRSAEDDDGRDAGETDEAPDWWVPALLLASFAWTVTCWPDGLEPRTLAVWVTALTAVMVAGAMVAGRSWVRRSSPFAVLCGTIAAGSPVDWSGGRVRFRSPPRGLAARAGGRRSLAAVVVVLGASVWDVTASTRVWSDLIAGADRAGGVLWSTFGLCCAIFVVGAAWLLVARGIEIWAQRSGGEDLDEPLDADLAPALAVLAAVAPLAHQLATVIHDGQQVWSLASDPLARGWNLFRTATYATDATLLASGVVAWIQLFVIGTGLALMMVAMWDRLASRIGKAVLTVGWAATAWTAVSGCLALSFLLKA